MGAEFLRRVIVLTLLAGLAAPGLAYGQDPVIGGTVTDATGLVLPGVIVEARSTEAGGPIEATVTDGAGAFAIRRPWRGCSTTRTASPFRRSRRVGSLRPTTG